MSILFKEKLDKSEDCGLEMGHKKLFDSLTKFILSRMQDVFVSDA